MKQDAGKQQSDTLVAQGADVIFPVAGGAGLGSAAAAKAGNYSIIWVDADGYETTQYKRRHAQHRRQELEGRCQGGR